MIKSGQHIFIPFRNGKCILDSQLRPRIYSSFKKAQACSLAWGDGKSVLAEYAPLLEWISIKDRLPKDKTRCLCAARFYGNTTLHMLTFYKSHKTENGTKANNAFWDYDGECGDYFYTEITHWQPLPEPPEENSNAKK